MSDPRTPWRDRLGPGLLFAAAAVGTSHLVQSTRAGAASGLTFGVIILGVCLLKYPLFRFAAQYSAATGEGLVAGYRRRGRVLAWAVFGAAVVEAVAATAGVSLVTASIARWIAGINLDIAVSAIVLLAIAAPLAALGRYRVLVTVTVPLMIGLSLLTLFATGAGAVRLLAEHRPLFGALSFERADLLFVASVSGWMPIGNIASIMLAGWVLANRTSRHLETGDAVSDARFDFNIGYWGSALLALCFLFMGTVVLFGRADGMPSGSFAFVASFVDLYAATVGPWSRWIVSVAALGVMLSTLLAIIDGFPRLLAEFVGGPQSTPTAPRRNYLLCLAFIVVAATLVLLLFLKSFTSFIDVMTLLGFLVAPVVAVANQLAISGPNVPPEYRPSRGLILWNQASIVALVAATATFLLLRA